MLASPDSAGDVASAVLALCPGGECCFRFFCKNLPPFLTRSPSSLSLQYSGKPRFHHRKHQEGSPSYTLVTDSRQCGYATQPPSTCLRPSSLKYDIHLLRDYIHMPSRNWCPGWDCAIWSDHVFGQSIVFVSCVLRPAFFFAAVAVAPINVLAGATDDRLLHVCAVVALRLAARHFM